MPSPATPKPHLQEALGLAMLVCGALLFLSLISYAPRDLPAWFPLASVSTPNKDTLNFIGPVGAIIASVCYALLGAAAYLLPVDGDFQYRACAVAENRQQQTAADFCR